ncbi:hypothetical protein [Microcystis phage Mwe-JY25]
MARLTVEERLERGDRLRMGFTHRGRFWWFDCPYQIVSEERVRRLEAVGSNMRIVEAGDSLFGLRGNSQTWMAARGTA